MAPKWLELCPGYARRRHRKAWRFLGETENILNRILLVHNSESKYTSPCQGSFIPGRVEMGLYELYSYFRNAVLVTQRIFSELESRQLYEFQQLPESKVK